MARYIDADRLIKELESRKVEFKYTYVTEALASQGKLIRKAIEETPAADVEEVVRCKDCVLHEKGCPLDTHPYMTLDDGYCYKGERRAEE